MTEAEAEAEAEAEEALTEAIDDLIDLVNPARGLPRFLSHLTRTYSAEDEGFPLPPGVEVHLTADNEGFIWATINDDPAEIIRPVGDTTEQFAKSILAAVTAAAAATEQT